MLWLRSCVGVLLGSIATIAAVSLVRSSLVYAQLVPLTNYFLFVEEVAGTTQLEEFVGNEALVATNGISRNPPSGFVGWIVDMVTDGSTVYVLESYQIDYSSPRQQVVWEWNGVTWTNIIEHPSLVNDGSYELTVTDIEWHESTLYAAGGFKVLSPDNPANVWGRPDYVVQASVIRWTGSEWEVVGPVIDAGANDCGITDHQPTDAELCTCMGLDEACDIPFYAYSSVAGARLASGGDGLYVAGGSVHTGYPFAVALFDGSAWQSVGGISHFASDPGGGYSLTPATIYDLVVNGSEVYVAGDFTRFATGPGNFENSVVANGVAKFDGATWTPMSLPVSPSAYPSMDIAKTADGSVYLHRDGDASQPLQFWNGVSWQTVSGMPHIGRGSRRMIASGNDLYFLGRVYDSSVTIPDSVTPNGPYLEGVAGKWSDGDWCVVIPRDFQGDLDSKVVSAAPWAEQELPCYEESFYPGSPPFIGSYSSPGTVQSDPQGCCCYKSTGSSVVDKFELTTETECTEIYSGQWKYDDILESESWLNVCNSSSMCQIQLCGNGTVDSGEECDSTATASSSDDRVCKSDCTWTQCSDGEDNDGDCYTDCDDPQCATTESDGFAKGVHIAKSMFQMPPPYEPVWIRSDNVFTVSFPAESQEEDYRQVNFRFQQGGWFWDPGNRMVPVPEQPLRGREFDFKFNDLAQKLKAEATPQCYRDRDDEYAHECGDGIVDPEEDCDDGDSNVPMGITRTGPFESGDYSDRGCLEDDCFWTECSDGEDNDGDGTSDEADPECLVDGVYIKAIDTERGEITCKLLDDPEATDDELAARAKDDVVQVVFQFIRGKPDHTAMQSWVDELLKYRPFADDPSKVQFWYMNGKVPDEIDPFVPSSTTSTCNDACGTSLTCAQLPTASYVNVCSESCRAAVQHERRLMSLSFPEDRSDPRVFVHEMGHLLGDLADEYVEDGKRDSPNYPNCAPSEADAKMWWGHLLARKDVGMIPGCSYTDDNYRPTESSIMRQHIDAAADPPDGFGPVNILLLESRLRMYTGPSAPDAPTLPAFLQGLGAWLQATVSGGSAPSDDAPIFHEHALAVTVERNADGGYDIVRARPTRVPHGVKPSYDDGNVLRVDIAGREFSQTFPSVTVQIAEEFTDDGIHLKDYRETPIDLQTVFVGLGDVIFDGDIAVLPDGKRAFPQVTTAPCSASAGDGADRCPEPMYLGRPAEKFAECRERLPEQVRTLGGATLGYGPANLQRGRCYPGLACGCDEAERNLGLRFPDDDVQVLTATLPPLMMPGLLNIAAQGDILYVYNESDSARQQAAPLYNAFLPDQSQRGCRIQVPLPPFTTQVSIHIRPSADTTDTDVARISVQPRHCSTQRNLPLEASPAAE